MKHLSTKTQGIMLAISAYSIFAFTDVCLKVTTSVYDPFAVGLYMNIFTILFMIPVIFACGGFKKTMATKSFKFHALRSGMMLISFICIIYALGQLPLTTAYVIIFCMPFILNIMAVVLLKEHISINRWVSIAIGFIGVIIALRPGYTPLGLGVFAIAIGTFLLAGGAICVRYIDKKDHWLSYTIYLMFLQTPILAAIVLFRGGTLLPNLGDMTTIPWFVSAGFLYVIALSFMPQAYQKIDTSIVAALIYLVFPWGILYGYFIFNDVADHYTLLGATLIILSGIYLFYREYKTHQKQNIRQEETE